MYFMNNATSCNVCVFESRNKWEMAACFVVLSTTSWVIPCEKHCMTSSRTFSPQNETCDTYKNLLQECIPLYYSQTHTYLKYWGAIQSTLCVYHVILEGRWMLKLVETSNDFLVVVSWLWPSFAPTSYFEDLSLLSWGTLYISIAADN